MERCVDVCESNIKFGFQWALTIKNSQETYISKALGGVV